MVAILRSEQGDYYDDLPLNQVIHGDCRDILRRLPPNSIDAIVTDPPGNLSFMGKKWDTFGTRDNFIAFLAEVFSLALKCLKPGASCLVWSLPRTSHWTGLALEQAGFEMRDCLYHVQAQDSAMAAFEASLTETQRDALARLIDSQETYPTILALFGSGFPKSQNISAMIDKMAGVDRKETVWYDRYKDGGTRQKQEVARQNIPLADGRNGNEKTLPVTDLAKKFAGTGSALKPACENWWLCRKPLSEKTLAANVLRWNCGGLNIDKSRVGSDRRTNKGMSSLGVMHDDKWISDKDATSVVNGRFPSNVLFSHSLFCTDTVCDASCPVRVLGEQSGTSVSKAGNRGRPWSNKGSNEGWKREAHLNYTDGYCGISDTGTASRFFHCFTPDVPFLYASKASRSERNIGCEELEPAQTFDKNTSKRIAHINHETGDTTYNDYIPSSNQNTHPTVKSLSLMKYLCNLICPPDGIVLDPFFGSGSTGVAALQSGLHFIGIEQELEYVTIARARIAHALQEAQG